MFAEIDWNQLLDQPDALPMIIMPLMTLIIVLGVTFAIQWRKVQVAKYDAQIKQQMIDQGFSADDILKVCSRKVSRAQRAELEACCPPAHPASRELYES